MVHPLILGVLFGQRGKLFKRLIILTAGVLIGISAVACVPGEPIVQNGNNTFVPNVTAVNQQVVPDPNNSSTANISIGSNFTGTKTSTLGVNAIQVSLKTDADMTVYVQQSPDGTNWDIQDHFHYLNANGGDSWTVQAVNSWERVVVVNANTHNTTYFRLQTVLCPIVDALPRAPSDRGLLQTQSELTDDYGNYAEISPHNELKITQSVKLAGQIFTGTVVDSNFWTVNTSNNGGVFQDARTASTGGELTLATNTTANGTARISSIRRGRYVAGNANFGNFIIHLPDVGTVNNTRRWGIADFASITNVTDGAWFTLNGTTLSVVTMRGGTATVISSGNFNGLWGTSYHLDTNNVHQYEIYYTSYEVLFSIDDMLLERITSDPMPWANTLTLYIYMDNFNTGGQTANVLMHVRSASIHRLGPTYSSPKYVHIAGANTTVCKYSAGTLQSIVINNPTNNAITVYDNTAGNGTIIAVLTPQANSNPIAVIYGIDFSNGLTVVTAGAAVDLTIVYESFPFGVLLLLGQIFGKRMYKWWLN